MAGGRSPGQLPGGCSGRCSLEFSEGPGGSQIEGSPTFTHCIHQENITGTTSPGFPRAPTFAIEGAGSHLVSWSNLPAVVGGVGNIDEDPVFMLPNSGDYRLSEYSPCVNRGDPTLALPGHNDFEGEPRVQHGVIDMGHDELGVVSYRQPGTTASGSLRLMVNESPWERHLVNAGEVVHFEIEGPGFEGSPLMLVV